MQGVCSHTSRKARPLPSPSVRELSPLDPSARRAVVEDLARKPTARWRRWAQDPLAISYVMGPLALVAILALRHFGLVAREPAWLWVSVFIVIPAVSGVLEVTYRKVPSRFNVHARVAWHAASVTTVIYLSGWGPALVGAFTFVALENVSHDGSRMWRVTAFWSVLGIAVGQFGIRFGWIPSLMSQQRSAALGIMGTFVLFFIIRMAGATSEKAELAEASVRTSEDRFRSLVQNSTDATLVMGAHGMITYASPAISGLLGRTPDDVVGQLAGDLVHPDERAQLEKRIAANLFDLGVIEPVQFRMKHANGTWRYVEAVLSDQRGRPSVAGYVGNVRDVTERKEAEFLLAHQALHDPLTGLPNRMLLVDRLRQAIARSARRESAAPVVMFLDLDRFKLVNDSLGHGAGDELLIRVADRLRDVLRATDTLCRFGGDEFVMLCEGIVDEDSVLALAERTMQTFDDPFTLKGEQFHIGVSIGVAFVDDDDASAEELLSDADFAMYLAKARNGQGRIQLFDQKTRAVARQRVHTETALARALDRDELVVYYQPIVDVISRRAVSVEALLRWQHPTRGLLLPASFLDVAEQTGLIVPIGSWVLGQASRQVSRWNDGLPLDEQLGLSVNVSGRQLIEPDLARNVAATLQESGVDPRSVKLLLEVTETVLPSDREGARQHLEDLSQLGVQLAIDDFGTGYSSLRYVKELPISIVKIDQSFVAGLGRSRQDEAIVDAVIQLATALNLEVVAEGVETEAQLSYLAEVGCDYAQGYLFGFPKPADHFSVPSITKTA